MYIQTSHNPRLTVTHHPANSVHAISGVRFAHAISINLTYSHQVTGLNNTMPSLPHMPRPRLRLQIDTPAIPHVTTPSPSTSEQPTSLTSQHKLNHKSSQATAQPNLKHQVQVQVQAQHHAHSVHGAYRTLQSRLNFNMKGHNA